MCKQLFQQQGGLLQAGVGQHHRFGLVDRVLDHALGVQAVHGVPVEGFPGALVFVQAQGQQGEDGVVDAVGVEGHGGAPGAVGWGGDFAGINRPVQMVGNP
jgi:hypothetical protein